MSLILSIFLALTFIALIIFILVADRSFLALGDRIERQARIINILRADGGGSRRRISLIEKKMKDEDPHHKLDIIFDKLEILWEREKATEDQEARLDIIFDKLEILWEREKATEDQEARLDALVFQISKKDAVTAEALSTLSDEVSALRQMRGAKR